MDYLLREDLKQEFFFNKERLDFIAYSGVPLPFVNDKEVNSSTKVFVKIRCFVNILPKTKFDKEFKTHRNLTIYVGKYEDVFLPHITDPVLNLWNYQQPYWRKSEKKI